MGISRDEAGIAGRNRRPRPRRPDPAPISPLKQALDAGLLDTTSLAIEPAFAAALDLVSAKVESALKDRQRG